MNKRIRKKRLRNALLRKLQAMQPGEGIVMVDGELYHFTGSTIAIETNCPWLVPSATIQVKLSRMGALL